MPLPVGFSDLSLWAAITAIILLTTSELLFPYYGRAGIMIDRKRLRVVALAVALIFLATMAYRVYDIVARP